MRVRRSREPLLWALFSAGGMLSALILPALALVLLLAWPLGWVEGFAHGELLGLWTNPVVRIFVFSLIMLGLFHWAHRFRYTLYDGLQLYHLDPLIAALTYGVATVLTIVAGYVLLILG